MVVRLAEKKKLWLSGWVRRSCGSKGWVRKSCGSKVGGEEEAMVVRLGEKKLRL